MTLHVALIEPRTAPTTGNVMRLCTGADVPLHLIGPVGFDLDAQDATRAERAGVDLWEHPDWFAFRDAISRERCIYFTADARVDYVKAPFKANSVLVFGNEKDGMPARIVEKHRQRCYRLPPGAFAHAVSSVLYEGRKQLGLPGGAPVFEDAEDHEVNFNVAVPVPAMEAEEEEDEINYNVEQKPRVTPHGGWGARGAGGRGGPGREGAPRGGPKGPGPRGGAKGPGPRAGGRPRRGRGGRGRTPKP